ncbi:sulfur carrier protein ThiS [Teredinibacter sp. KSP-S5-2]|uniref:sulfur carrier protein ThiS n=1 Tax=Teredinibacter sp. KSP-S5-2 TaxID=3034506 RepID=UPI0029342B90|nr:sulfur carrier protein ThiS [Teredinibacter sp. KSP-S5-2]WNO11028.1 sulfur carrier protein ThiS [Teredinibacter sp. KSP-S5-2]
MKNIHLNGNATQTSAQTLADLLSEINMNDESFAIAINQQFIPKENYANKIIDHGDTIEVLSPMQGG